MNNQAMTNTNQSYEIAALFEGAAIRLRAWQQAIDNGAPVATPSEYAELLLAGESATSELYTLLESTAAVQSKTVMGYALDVTHETPLVEA